MASEQSATFYPTVRELETLRRLEDGERIPTPADLKENDYYRLYEHGFVGALGGWLEITDRGRLLIQGRGKVLEQWHSGHAPLT